MNLEELSNDDLIIETLAYYGGFLENKDSLELKKGVEDGRTELLRRLARAEELVKLVKKLEWSGVHDYSTGWPCCPICKGIKPGYGKDSQGRLPYYSGHRDYCELKNLIAAGRKVR